MKSYNSKISLFLGIISTFVLVSCGHKSFENKERLLDYLKVEDNGYVQKKLVNGVNYSLLYRPTDLLVEQELGTDSDEAKIKVLREKYSQYMYFNLSMSHQNKELLSTAVKNRNEFGAMVNQLAFGMAEKVHVYTPAKDTLAMADFIYPRMYGMSKATTIMFVFPRDKEKLAADYLNFVIEDLGLYTGDVKFKIPTETIINEPKLIFKEK